MMHYEHFKSISKIMQYCLNLPQNAIFNDFSGESFFKSAFALHNFDGSCELWSLSLQIYEMRMVCI